MVGKKRISGKQTATFGLGAQFEEYDQLIDNLLSSGKVITAYSEGKKI